MAVYQGTRQQVLLPGARRAVGPVERRPRRTTSRAQRRVRPVALILVGIVAAFLLGLVHLTQTLQAAAVRYEIDSLRAEQAQLHREIQTQLGTIARWGSEPQVLEWAQQNGLSRLGGKIHVPSP